ncbi:MAG TPA: non-homologous end-joining DNA ligase [Actinomycetota bacterium]|nr:non-homologous end-joining DNA ligase [Actinomycetota bacterium]
MTTPLRVGRRTIEVSRRDKPLWPRDGITKGALVDYYAGVAPAMVPHLRGRLLTLERYPDGIEGGRFFSKEIPRHFPEWVDRFEVAKEGGTVTHVVCNRPDTLVYLANQACITMHAGLSRVDDVDTPDHMIYDLDPSSDDFGVVRSAARAMRALLDELGLASFVKTSGSRGLHVVVPFDRRQPFRDVRAFARDVARVAAERDPERVTVEQRKDNRRGRLFLDWMRNAYGQHAAAPYTVRARPGAPVATPLSWDELDEPDMHARRFTMDDVLRRVDEGVEPWRGWRRRARGLAGARRRLDRLDT